MMSAVYFSELVFVGTLSVFVSVQMMGFSQPIKAPKDFEGHHCYLV